MVLSRNCCKLPPLNANQNHLGQSTIEFPTALQVPALIDSDPNRPRSSAKSYSHSNFLQDFPKRERTQCPPLHTPAPLFALGFSFGKFSAKEKSLARFLAIRKGDAHLFQCGLVKCSRGLQSFLLLILPQGIARRVVKLARLVPAIEATLFQYGLSLVDLILGGAEYGPTFAIGVGSGVLPAT